MGRQAGWHEGEELRVRKGTWVRWVRWGSFCGLFLMVMAVGGATAAEDESRSCPDGEPWAAVHYVEMPSGGKLEKKGRDFLETRQPEYGIDINSWVKITISPDCLMQTLRADQRTVPQVSTRIDALQGAVSAFAGAADAVATESHPRDERERGEGAMRSLSMMDNSYSAIIQDLVSAIRLREKEAGLDDRSLESRSVNALLAARDRGPRDWTLVGSLVQRELDLLCDTPTGLRLEISAHLISGEGKTAPIRLKGLNDVDTGAARADNRVIDLVGAATPQTKNLQTTVVQAQKEGSAALSRLSPAASDCRAGESASRPLCEMLDLAEAAVNLVIPPCLLPPVSVPLRSTSFNLTTIKADRKVNDVVRVQYRMLTEDTAADDDKDPDMVVRWEDDFLIRSFGWHQTLSAGFAFLQQVDSSNWSPVPLASWTTRPFRWPNDFTANTSYRHDPGRWGWTRAQWFSGMGFSLLLPDFVEEEEVEVGLGAHLSFLDNRVIVGYGLNLNAENDAASGQNREFWFLGIRLFKGKAFDKVQKAAE